jgi:ParB family chromosome partitioning protein
MAGSKADKPSKALLVDSIQIGRRKRPVDEAAVANLMKSMKQFGLMNPITIRVLGASAILVAGQQRLEAARRLGWATIDAICVDCDDIDAEMIEIVENLDRAELAAQDRAAQLAELVRLYERRAAEFPDNASEKSRGRPQGGAAAASRALGLGEKEVQRAVKIDRMSPEVKKAAAEFGLADNQSALEKIASAPPEMQIEAVKEEAGRRAAKTTSNTSRKARQAWAQAVANELIIRYGADVVRAVAQACHDNLFVMSAILAITDNERSAA